MNLKSLIIGFVLILIIVFGISKLLGTLSDRQGDASSHLKETVGLRQKVKGLTETRAKQIQEREEQFQE